MSHRHPEELRNLDNKTPEEIAMGYKQKPTAVHDTINHPHHYTRHPSGVECITITEHMGFNLGNAIKYIWRADLKGNSLEDLKKARWYIDREIALREPKPTTGGGDANPT